MKEHIMVLLVLVVAAALSVSGCCCCSGIPGGSDINIGVPTSLPGTNNNGPSPGSDDSLSSRSLFDSSNLKYYEWRWTSTSDGETNTFNYRVERGTESYNGANARYKKVTFTDNGGEPSTMTVYYDSTGEKVIGLTSNGEEIPIEYGGEDMAEAFDAYDVGAIWASYDYDLSGGVPDVLNINGKTYNAQKYTAGTIYGGTTIWSAIVDGKPMAVQIKYNDMQGNSLVYQLWDWG